MLAAVTTVFKTLDLKQTDKEKSCLL